MRYQLTPIFCRPWTLNGLSRRMQRCGRAAGGWIRCQVHEGRPLGLEGDRRRDEDPHLTSIKESEV